MDYKTSSQWIDGWSWCYKYDMGFVPSLFRSRFMDLQIKNNGHNILGITFDMIM
jgi:hypothetical protein